MLISQGKHKQGNAFTDRMHDVSPLMTSAVKSNSSSCTYITVWQALCREDNNRMEALRGGCLQCTRLVVC